MRTVEKWLKGKLLLAPPPLHVGSLYHRFYVCSDIEATVKSIEIGPADGGVASCHDEESVDYQAEYETTESEVEAILMQDSMEDFYSFSDTEET